MTKKTQLFIIILIVLIFFGLGYAFSSLKNKRPANDTFKAGWDASQKRISDSGILRSDKENVEMRQVLGEIKEINDNKITLKVQAFGLLSDASLDMRIIVVDSATKIYSLEIKNLKEYGAELSAYNKLPQNKKPATPPDNFKKTEISISDLQVGQMIIIKADKDIKELKEFNATEIDYNKPEISVPLGVSTTTPTTPATPPAR